MQTYSSIFYKADQHRAMSFESLLALDDVSLAPGQEYVYKCPEAHFHVVIPVVGGLVYQGAGMDSVLLNAEEVLCDCGGHQTVSVKNEHTTQAINFLWLVLQQRSPQHIGINVSAAQLRQYNVLVPLQLEQSDRAYHASIGIFSGRTKGQYMLQQPGCAVFAFVINGAFELEERLMEHRDGLALRDLDSVTFEALSEFAILLLLELPLSSV